MDAREVIALEEVRKSIQDNLNDDVISSVLKSGLDLRNYSSVVEDQVAEAEKQSIQDYVSQSKDIGKLYLEIQTCDSILERMESILCNFQNDLGNISDDIQGLQSKSLELQIRLKNRQSIRGELSQYVAEMIIPLTMINTISEVAVTERSFLEQLHELDHKIKYVLAQTFQDAKASQDVALMLEKLKVKATIKIREFLLEKIYSVRKPLSNYEIPQGIMLKYRFFNEFLLRNEPEMAREIKEEYIETMSKVYFSYFKDYCQKLLKLQQTGGANREVLICSDELKRSHVLLKKQTLRNSNTIFSIGNRLDVLTTELEAPVIIPHSAASTQTKYPLEALFRSLNYTLVDISCREYFFLSDFFCVGVGSSQVEDIFNAVMGKCLHWLGKQAQPLIMSSYDSLALLLCSKLVQRFSWIMQNRGVNMCGNYWNHQLDCIWSRWDVVVDENIQSCMQYNVSQAALIADTRPHRLTRRYAEYCAACHAICQLPLAESSIASTSETAVSNDDGIKTEFAPVMEKNVSSRLLTLQNCIESILKRLANQAFSLPKDQFIFLINNYDLILSVLSERYVPDDSFESRRFSEQLRECTFKFIDCVLTPYFGSVMTLLMEYETAQLNLSSLNKHEEARINQVVRGFQMEWRQNLERIQNELQYSFTNFKNGNRIFQAVLSEFLQYYQRLKKLLSHNALRSVAQRHDMQDLHNVMVELKKYRSNF